MNFKEMVEKISLLEETQQKRVDILRKKQQEQEKEEIEHIDFESIDLDDLLVPMVNSVNFTIGIKDITSPVYILHDILSVKNLKLIPKEEKQKALSIILSELKGKQNVIEPYLFDSIFNDKFISYKDSIRMITEGEKVTDVLSKQKEKDIVNTYISIFEQQLSYYFDFISYDEYAKNYIPLALKLAFIPGSRYSKIKKHHVFDFILMKICPRVTEPSFIHSILKEHYQKEQLTFATPKNLGDIRFVKKYSFLLSHEQQKEIVEQFIPICMDKIHYYTSILQEESDDNPDIFLKQLYSFKKNLEFLHELQKGMMEDELK